MHHHILYISLPFLHNSDVKIPYFAFYGERKQAKTKFYFLFKLGYRKIPKKRPGAYIFQRPFLRCLFLEGLIFGGAYLRREICVSKTNWVTLIVGSKFNVFALFYSETCIKRTPLGNAVVSA